MAPSSTALYSAFDVFPSPKGAATHIRQMAATLFDYYGPGLLYCLGDHHYPNLLQEEEAEIHRWNRPIANYLDRALTFSEDLQSLLESRGADLRLCHFRDPWSGKAIFEVGRKLGYKTIYEVNGLPSIELLEKYSLPEKTIEKIKRLEDHCLDSADLILTPAASIKRCLVGRGVNEKKIKVLSNGADIHSPVERSGELPTRYAVYFGALQRWQGLDTALRAFALLSDLQDFSLIICSASHQRLSKPYRRLIEKLGIADRVQWKFGLSQPALHAIVSHADLTLAPLKDCARNSLQGCCPLKILESLAAGTPVLASRLPSVEDLISDGKHGILVRPDRPSELGRALRVALECPERLRKMGQNGEKLIRERYSWDHIRSELKVIYQSIAPRQDSPASHRGRKAQPAE